MSNRKLFIMLSRLVAVLFIFGALVPAALAQSPDAQEQADGVFNFLVVDSQGKPANVYYILQPRFYSGGERIRKEGFIGESGSVSLTLPPREYELRLGSDFGGSIRRSTLTGVKIGRERLRDARTMPYIKIEAGQVLEKTYTFDQDAPSEGRGVGLPQQSRFGKKVDTLIGLVYLAFVVFIIAGGQSLSFFKRKQQAYDALPPEERRKMSIRTTGRVAHRLMILGPIGMVLGWLIGSPVLTILSFAGGLMLGLILHLSVGRLIKFGGGVTGKVDISGQPASPEEVLIGVDELVKRFQGGSFTRMSLEQAMNLDLIKVSCPVCSKVVHPRLRKTPSLRLAMTFPLFALASRRYNELVGKECEHIVVAAAYKPLFRRMGKVFLIIAIVLVSIIILLIIANVVITPLLKNT